MHDLGYEGAQLRVLHDEGHVGATQRRGDAVEGQIPAELRVTRAAQVLRKGHGNLAPGEELAGLGEPRGVIHVAAHGEGAVLEVLHLAATLRPPVRADEGHAAVEVLRPQAVGRPNGCNLVLEAHAIHRREDLGVRRKLAVLIQQRRAEVEERFQGVRLESDEDPIHGCVEAKSGFAAHRRARHGLRPEVGVAGALAHDAQALLAAGGQVAAHEEAHVVAGLEEPAAVVQADGAGAHDGDTLRRRRG
mmetsp:Transcript_10281/g.30732  ORF Transcript_10281/g.30732 Transcript_10281/m.30732 type:complete len:247 (+) Transcript_10281:515-1255(+)